MTTNVRTMSVREFVRGGYQGRTSPPVVVMNGGEIEGSSRWSCHRTSQSRPSPSQPRRGARRQMERRMAHFRRKHPHKHPGDHSHRLCKPFPKLGSNSREATRPSDRRRLDAARSQT